MRYWIVAGSVPALLLVIYALSTHVHLPLLTAPDVTMQGAGALAGLLGFGLLVGDVLLPIPSSVVMTANGALLGAAGGALVSLAGRVASFALGYWLGLNAMRLARQFVAAEDLAAGAALLERRGWIAIAVSRPMPIVSETVSIMAGLSRLPLRSSLVAALLGSIPESMLFAAMGAAIFGP